jgi:hypothetical protein
MNDINRMTNKSLDDLLFLQNKINKNQEKFVFVFDFDLTLTTISSDSVYFDSDYIILFDNDEKLSQLKAILYKLNLKDYPIYINTRALVHDVKHIFNKVGLFEYIKDIKGSTSFIHITIPFNEQEKNKYQLTELDDIHILWAVKKVIILNEISETEKVPSDNILFFDDNSININTAKLNGYLNSYLIGNNESGIFGLDYLLIKLNQILEIIENY